MSLLHESVMDVIDHLWVVVGLIWLLTAFGQKKAAYVESSVRTTFYELGSIAAFMLLFWSRFGYGKLATPLLPITSWLPWTGLGCAVAGFALAFWARMTLGGEWSSKVALKQGHTMVTRGPYAYMRHPIYSGMLLAMVGTAVAGNQVRMFLAVIIAFATWWYKSRLEEELLIGAMGPAYREYRRRTRAFIPGLL